MLVYVALAIVFAVFALTLYLYYQQTYFGTAYQKAISSQNPSDICATPAGYTDEAWRTHMSHHPDAYSQCFQK